MKKALLLLLVVLCYSAGARSSYACSCSKPNLTEHPFKKFWFDTALREEVLSPDRGAIFTGKVLDVQKAEGGNGGGGWYGKRVTFKVDRYWQGEDNSEVIVHTGFGGGDCGFPFRKGDSYIVFATKIKDRLHTDICTWTAESLNAANIIEALELGEGKQPTMRPAKP